MVAIARTAHFDEIAANRQVAELIATHKGWLFQEKAADDSVVVYHATARGGIRLFPMGQPGRTGGRITH
ncbi:hypothetical protein D9M68_919040 [compost metagenome]